MEEISIRFQHYMQTGGITMYPLILCCFWMWLLILFNLPLWRRSLDRRSGQLRSVYQKRQQDNRRHNRQLYAVLLKQEYGTSVKGLATIRILGLIVPFLGLFGTVTGMINTFESVAVYGLGNPKALAAGISEAMITTQFGLLVALPGILAAYFLQRRAYRDHRKLMQMTGDLLSHNGV